MQGEVRKEVRIEIKITENEIREKIVKNTVQENRKLYN